MFRFAVVAVLVVVAVAFQPMSTRVFRSTKVEMSAGKVSCQM
jgi:hypothetical protein